jgi:hypothetical protein
MFLEETTNPSCYVGIILTPFFGELIEEEKVRIWLLEAEKGDVLFNDAVTFKMVYC